MKLKVLIQFSLLLIVLVTCLAFYKLFLKNPNAQLNKEKIEQNDKSTLYKNTNQINDIVYRSNYLDDNKYLIKAEFGEYKKEKPGTMLLTNVRGTIFLKNSEKIEISSKKALYDGTSYNTNFYKDVLIIFNDHKIYSDNFDLFFDKKISTIHGNVIYKDLNTALKADKIDIDLITKDSKVYMLNNSEKIIIKNLN